MIRKQTKQTFLNDTPTLMCIEMKRGSKITSELNYLKYYSVVHVILVILEPVVTNFRYYELW